MNKEKITHSVYTDFEQAHCLRDAWDKLAEAAGNIYCTFDWCEVWWKHFGSARRLQIHAIFSESRLIGVMPLFYETFHFGLVNLNAVRFVGSDHTLAPAGMVFASGAMETVVKSVISKLDAWDVIFFGPMRGYAANIERLAKACEDFGPMRVGRNENCVTVYDLGNGYDGYMRRISSHERKNIERCDRRVKEIGDVTLQRAKSEEEINAMMDALVRLHQSQWNAKGGAGQFAEWPGYEAFHREMATRQSKCNRLALLELRSKDQTLASEYGYVFGNRVYGLIRGTSEDSLSRTYSAGRMIHCRMVKAGASSGADEMDDGRGAFEYKRRLGGRLSCEVSLTLVRREFKSFIRFHLALSAAYLAHVVYRRMWFDGIRPKLRLRFRPLRQAYIRIRFLADLHRRTQFFNFWNLNMRELHVHNRQTGVLADEANRTKVRM